MPGASISPCRIDSLAEYSATTRSPSCRATVTCGVAVSKASSTAPRLRQPGLTEHAPRTGGEPPGTDRCQGRGADVVARPLQTQLEAVVAQCLGQARPPLDHRDRRVE